MSLALDDQFMHVFCDPDGGATVIDTAEAIQAIENGVVEAVPERCAVCHVGTQTCADIDCFAPGYVNRLEPSLCITTIRPRCCAVGDVIIVNGYGFAPDTQLFAGFVAMDDIVNVSSTEIHARMPALHSASITSCTVSTVPTRGQDPAPRCQRVTLCKPDAATTRD